jgi:hypothetical protein
LCKTKTKTQNPTKNFNIFQLSLANTPVQLHKNALGDSDQLPSKIEQKLPFRQLNEMQNKHIQVHVFSHLKMA